MSDEVDEIGRSHFARSREAERASAAEDRRAAADAALAALHAARARFVEHAAGIYVSGAEAALGDCDRLEEIADQLITAIDRLRPAFDRLDVARDLALYRGATLNRARSAYDAGRLADLAAEVLSEQILCGPAAAVLAAAVRRNTAG